MIAVMLVSALVPMIRLPGEKTKQAALAKVIESVTRIRMIASMLALAAQYAIHTGIGILHACQVLSFKGVSYIAGHLVPRCRLTV